MNIPGRIRAQNRILSKEPARTWRGDDSIARIAAVAAVTEPAVCPSCHIVSKLVHISEAAALATTEFFMIPSMAPGEVLRQAQCILCAIDSNSVVQAQEAHAGRIWFLIGDTTGQIPNQAALNQHYWAVIGNSTTRQRQAARKQLLEATASKTFGCLQPPHQVLPSDEKTWLASEIQRCLGTDANGLLDEDSTNAFIDQFGVPMLLRSRKPMPNWAHLVRFVPTHEGVEHYSKEYAHMFKS